MGNENSSPESQDIQSVPESIQPPSNEREAKKKKQRRKNKDRTVEENDFDSSPVDSAVSHLLPDNEPSLAAGDARGSWPLMSERETSESYQSLVPHNLLFTGFDVNEESRSQMPVTSSLSNEGLCSNAGEESLGANIFAVSPEVTALEDFLHQQEQAVSDFSEWASEGNKDKSQVLPMPLVECVKEHAAVSLEDTYGELPGLLSYPNTVNDKTTRTIPDPSLSSDSDTLPPAATFAIKDEKTPDDFSSALNPLSDATWMPGAGTEQTISSESDSLQQSEQLNDKQNVHVVPLPMSEEGLDYCIPQGTSQPGESLEGGHGEQTVLKLGGQNTDGPNSLVMKKETLILNCPTAGGSDTEKHRAVVEGQSFVSPIASISESSNDTATSKRDDPYHIFPEENSEHSGLISALHSLPFTPCDLSLITMTEEKNRGCPPERECPDQTTSKPETLFLTKRENRSGNLLVSPEPPGVSLLPEENEKQKASTAASEKRAEHASGKEITKAECVSEGNIALADPENLVCFGREDSIVDKRLSPLGNVKDFTSESELTELIKKDSLVSQENKDISLGEVGSQERPVLTSPLVQEEVNLSQGTLLNFDINKMEESPNTNSGDYWSFLANSVQSDAGGKVLENDLCSEHILNVPEEHLPELNRRSEREKTAPHEEEEDKSLLSVEALHLQEKMCPQSCDLLTEDTQLSFTACEMAEKICLVDTHGSLMLHSEDNAVMQNERDGSWEHTLSQRTEWELEGQAMHEITSEGNTAFAEIIPAPKAEPEHQDLNEQARIAGCITGVKTKIQEDLTCFESKPQMLTCSEAACVPVTVAEQSNPVGQRESNETGQEEYKIDMKSQVTNTNVAQKAKSKLDSLQQVQQEQVTEEHNPSMREDYSGSLQLTSNTVKADFQQTKLGDLQDCSIREHNDALESSDGETSLETLHRKAADVQQMVDIFMPFPQVEMKDSLESFHFICSNQHHLSKTELEKVDHASLTALRSSNEQQLNETLPERAHSQDSEDPSGFQPPCESEIKVIDDIHKPQIELQVKSNVSTAVADENAPLPNISESMAQIVEVSNLKTLASSQMEESCLDQQAISKLNQDVSDSLILSDLCEGADHSDAEEPVISMQSDGLHGLTDYTGESTTGITECDPTVQKTISPNVELPQTLTTDIKMTCADDGYKSNESNLKVTELAEKRSHTEIEEKTSLVDETTKKYEPGEINYERDLIVTGAENAGIQESIQLHSPLLPELTDMVSSNVLSKTDSIQKTEFLPADSQADLPTLSVPAFSDNQHTGVSQQPTKCMNDGIVDGLQKDELEITAYQGFLGATPNFQIVAPAATPVHSGDTSAEKSTADQRMPEVLNSDTIPLESVPEKDSVIPSQGKEESVFTSQDSSEQGQLEGNLSPFNFKKLQTEISAIKTKGAKSDVNFKAQQFDSSVESVFSLSSLEEKLLSLSSFGKQTDCNEDTATNIACVDDKHSESVQNIDNAEKNQGAFAENFSIPKMEISTPKSAETSEKQHDDQSSRTFGIGFFDFRKHISKIFEKTVPSTLTTEVPHHSAENRADERDSPSAKVIPQCKPGLEEADGIIGSADQKPEGGVFPLEAEVLDRATKQKIVQEEKSLTNSPEYCLSDAFSENIPIKKYYASEEVLTSLPKLDSQVDSSSSIRVKGEANECASAVSNDNSANGMSLETEKLQPAYSYSSETEDLPPSSDSELSLMITSLNKFVPASDFGRMTMAEVGEGSLISLGSAEPGSSENQCHNSMPSVDKGTKENVTNLGNTSALPHLLHGLCVYSEQMEQSSKLPDENKKKSTCCNLLDENTLQEKAFESTTSLSVLIDSQEKEKTQDIAIHGLIDYLKNEVSLEDDSPGDCKPNDGCGEEVNDIMFSIAEAEEHISVDTPKTGIASTLFTADCVSPLQSSICDQGMDSKKISETIQKMEPKLFTDVPSPNQSGEQNLGLEKPLLDVQKKESTTSLLESEQSLPSSSLNVAMDGLPAKSISVSDGCQDTGNSDLPLPDLRSVTPQAPTEVEQPDQENKRLTVEAKRSSDSEEAFETPESTTPVKAAPPLPLPPPEVAAFDTEEQEVQAQLPSDDIGFCCDTVLIADVPHSESVEETPFQPPSHSFSTVFDEDKPIASSGTYNLDFDSIEVVDSLQAIDPGSVDTRNRDTKSHVRRKSTDSVPISRSTLSRSLSLQAGDFDGTSFLGNNETGGSATETFSTGSSSASSTLKRTKKPRPASLKKKQLAKKSLEVPPVKEPEPPDIKQDSAAESEGKVSEERLEPTESECTEPSQSAIEQQETPTLSTADDPFDPNSFEEISTSVAGNKKVQNSPPASKKVLPLTTAPEAVEVTPSDTGGPEDPPVKAVRLEFDYSEEKGSGGEQQESPPLPKKVGKKPGAKMPLRRPKTKKTGEKLDSVPPTPTKTPSDPNEIPVPKGSYTFDIDKWDDPNFNPFSSTCKMQDSPKLPQQTTAAYTFDPDVCEDSIDPFKPSSKVASSPTKSPASFEIPANANEINGTEGDGLSKPAKKKKTPLKTDTFRVKKSPKRSPLSDAPSQESTSLPISETTSVVSTVVHATDEEKLASSVGNQKWTCMTVDLDSDKQDYPQPSDLSTFVNETKFSSPTEAR
ncbi:uncharacterized protein LOC121924996 [Sceloporus undulatus]|uniref:uncharacterized protein LOC121924996 n=1 Tax=Sceloporus undulatus TaxID=8520 RepID=UPI001C4AE2D6|nr:uncharacterized protein LOC121924996 [Sceloporus undulatus]